MHSIQIMLSIIFEALTGSQVTDSHVRDMLKPMVNDHLMTVSYVPGEVDGDSALYYQIEADGLETIHRKYSIKSKRRADSVEKMLTPLKALLIVERVSKTVRNDFLALLDQLIKGQHPLNIELFKYNEKYTLRLQLSGCNNTPVIHIVEQL